MGTELIKGMIVTRKYLKICMGIFVYVCMSLHFIYTHMSP